MLYIIQFLSIKNKKINFLNCLQNEKRKKRERECVLTPGSADFAFLPGRSLAIAFCFPCPRAANLSSLKFSEYVIVTT